MKLLIAKVRPAGGFSQLAHIALLSLYPVLVLILVRLDFSGLALLVVLLSKWRMLAVKLRFWPANFRANSVDIMVSVALWAFVVHTDSHMWQLVWTAIHILWLMFIKPSSQTFMVGLQSLIAFLLALSALFLLAPNAHLFYLVVIAGLVCYLAAHHFFDAFEEAHTKMLSWLWAWFGGSVVWVLGHWLLYYANGLVAQPTVLLVAIGYGLAALYYLDHTDRLTSAVRNQFVFLMVAITLIVLIFSDWGNKII